MPITSEELETLSDTLTELRLLKNEKAKTDIENIHLKLQQWQTAANQIIDQQKALVESLRASLGVPAGHIYNIDTRTFQAPV